MVRYNTTTVAVLKLIRMSITINNSNVKMYVFQSQPTVEELAPNIDGHYWVERTGVIVAEEYLHNMLIEKYRKNRTPPVFVYRVAEPEHELRALAYAAKAHKKKSARELEAVYRNKPDGMCLYLAQEEARRNGGTVRFGAFGLADSETDYKKVYWFFGHANFSRYEDYFNCDESTLDKSKTSINDKRNYQFNPRPAEEIPTAEELEEKRKAALASWDFDLPKPNSSNKTKKSSHKKKR